MIDYRFTGSAAALGAGLRGIFPGGSASAAVQTTEAGVSVVVVRRGRRPRDQISVASMQDASSFLPTEEMTPVAMLAEFTPVNTGLPLRVRIQRITYDGQWDPVGGPEILVRVLHGITVVFPRLRGPQDETVWTVPTERGTFPTPVLVTRTTPLQFIFSDEDAVNDDPAGSLEIRLLSPSPDAQCFGGVNSTAPRVHVCLIVDE